VATIPTTTAATGAPAAAATTIAPVAGPPYAVAASTITLVDPSRPTPARGSVPAKAGRILRTLVRKPAGVATPLPLVVFVHGWDSEPETYETLLDTWAAAGYLVLAPECPGSAENLPGTPVSDYAAQALDVSFVVTRALAGVAGPVDRTRVVAAGHSDGGTTMAILALAPQYHDTRLKAYLSLAGQIPPDVSAPWGASRMPGDLLVAVGSADEYGNQQLSSQLYRTAQMTKAFLDVPGGSHLGSFLDDTPVARSVRQATVAFLDLVTETGPVDAATITAALESPPGASAYSVTAADN
jgi:predicted dienelactone hydrolase